MPRTKPSKGTVERLEKLIWKLEGWQHANSRFDVADNSYGAKKELMALLDKWRSLRGDEQW